MKMKFNKDKCLKLLQERKSLRKEGKSLWDYDKAKNDELIRYLTLLEDKFFWESRKEYIQILDLFVSKKITGDQFAIQFCTLRGLNMKSTRIWKEKVEDEAFVGFSKSPEVNIQVNPKSYGFGYIIEDLHILVAVHNPDVTLEMNVKHPELLYYGISDEYLRLRVEEHFLPELKKYCNKS